VGACDLLTRSAAQGAGPALRAIDCVAGEMTATTFGRLFGTGGALAPVLTALLTLYVAVFAFSLLTGRSALGLSALTPRMVTLGLVLTFATSWVAYQEVMWNLAVLGPDWIASRLTGTDGSATQVFADRIDLVFAALADRTASPSASGTAPGLFSPESILWLGGILLLLGTVGVLLTARIALAVLMALGPVFVVLGLFTGTRGLTAGWLRSVVLTALTPLYVVLAGGLTLELMVPVLRGLAAGADKLDGRMAMALFVLSAVHVALMAMVLRVSGTMVAGWRVFGLAAAGREVRAVAAAHAGGALPAAAAEASRDVERSRRAALVIAAAGPPSAAGGAHEGFMAGGRRQEPVPSEHAHRAPASHFSRASGIGSRFRAQNSVGRPPNARSSREMMR